MTTALLSFGCAGDDAPLDGEPIGSTGETDGGSSGSTSADPSAGTFPTNPTSDPTSADETGGCGGCLDDAGACQPGTADDQCGALGESCVPCDGATVCDEGACVEPPACSPDNCDGCCDGDNCVAGDADAACGAGGGQCSACPDGASCDGGICDLPCEDSCEGCCDGESCVEAGDQSDAECGVDGASCLGCEEGFECSAGECVSTACTATCDGCCDGATCLDGDAADECGVGGATCQSCGTNLSCGDTGCEPDPMALWDVRVFNGTVALTDADGDAWDSFNGLPDPYVSMEVVGNSGETAVIMDELFPEWDEVVLVGVNSVQLEGGLTVSVVDSDIGFDTTIATCVDDQVDYNVVMYWSCSDAEGYELFTLSAIITPSAG
ncbi:MAG: C2 domain-containing protein [Nannocystales bacterium]